MTKELGRVTESTIFCRADLLNEVFDNFMEYSEQFKDSFHREKVVSVMKSINASVSKTLFEMCENHE